MGAHQGTQGLRDREGEEAVRPPGAVCPGGAGATGALYAARTGDRAGDHRNDGRGVVPHSLGTERGGSRHVRLGTVGWH